MLLDHEACDRARVARDARFDGQFVTGVLTTRIYCRPICPVKPARSENVRFFPSAAAAERAGFRPCLRCRPEAAPGTPAWQGATAIVSRALGLIHRGFLDEHSVSDLAAELGVGPRHITRLFIKHLGASPGAVAATRRVQIAKKLSDETDMAITDIAFAAGFSSIRRFNAVFAQTYGRPPSQMRRGTPQDAGRGAEITVRLTYRPPFDWPFLAALLGAEATPGVEAIDEHGYRRTITAGGKAGWLHVQPVSGRNHLALTLRLPDYSRIRATIEQVRTVFDLSADTAQIRCHLAHDPELASLLRLAPNPRVPGAFDGFEVAVRVLLAEDIGTAQVAVAMQRLVEAYGQRVTLALPDRPRFLFPSPAWLAAAPLSGLGLSSSAIDHLRMLARSVVEGRLRFDATSAFDGLVSGLMRTGAFDAPAAQWVAMRTLGAPDAAPFGAPAVPHLGTQDCADPPRYDNWRPWRSYAAALQAFAVLNSHDRSVPERPQSRGDSG